MRRRERGCRGEVCGVCVVGVCMRRRERDGVEGRYVGCVLLECA